MRPPSRTSALGALILLLASATLSGCSEPAPTTTSKASSTPKVSLPPAAATTTPSPAPTSRTTSIAATKTQVIASYLGMQKAFLSASQTGDDADDELRKYAKGNALKLMTSGLKSLNRKGLRTRGETIFDPRVQQLEPAKHPTKARVRDCMDTRKSLLYNKRGQLSDDEPGGWRYVIADLGYENSTWKVTEVAIQGVGSCKG